VVWVASPKEAERLIALSDEQLSEAAEAQSHSILGRVYVEPGRNLFPLAIERPAQFARRRIVLVGEAAHVIPPIGAQGLNLGLRDAADIADIVREKIDAGDDPGTSGALLRYDIKRRPDVLSRTFAIDLANRSLLSDFLPVQSLRGPAWYNENLSISHAFGPGRIGVTVLNLFNDVTSPVPSVNFNYLSTDPSTGNWTPTGRCGTPQNYLICFNTYIPAPNGVYYPPVGYYQQTSLTPREVSLWWKLSM
jgi:hypothetical protein